MSGSQHFSTVGNGNNFDHPPSTIADPRHDETRQRSGSPSNTMAEGLWGHMLRNAGDRHEVLPSTAAEVVDTTTDRAPHILARARMRAMLEARLEARPEPRRRASPGSLFTRLQHQRGSRETGQHDRNLLAELQHTNERARQLLDSGLDVTGAVPDHGRSSDGQPRRKKRKTEISNSASKLYPTPYGYHGQATSTRLRMKLMSSDGGSCDDVHVPGNVLKQDHSVYCTDDSRCNLVLSHEGETMFTISKLSIRAPSAGYSHPVQQGLVFVSSSQDEIFERTRDYRIISSTHLAGGRTPTANTVDDPELGLRQWFRRYCDHSDDEQEDNEQIDETASDRDNDNALRDLVRRGYHTRQDRAARTARFRNPSPPVIDTNTHLPAESNVHGLLTPLSYFRLQPSTPTLAYTAEAGFNFRLPSYHHLTATTTLPQPPPPLWTQTPGRKTCRSHYHTSNQADGYSAVKVTTRQDIGGSKITLHFTPAVSARYLLLKLWRDDDTEHSTAAVPANANTNANANGVLVDNITYADAVLAGRDVSGMIPMGRSAQIPRAATPDSMPDLEPISPTSPPPENSDNNHDNDDNNNNNNHNDDDDSDFDGSPVPEVDIQEGIPITARDTEDTIRDRLISMGGWEPRQARILAEQYFQRRRGLLPPRQDSLATSDDNDNPRGQTLRAAGNGRRIPEPYIPGSILISPGDTVDTVRERLIAMGGYAPERAAELAERFFSVGESDDEDEADDGDDIDRDEDEDAGEDDNDDEEEPPQTHSSLFLDRPVRSPLSTGPSAGHLTEPAENALRHYRRLSTNTHLTMAATMGATTLPDLGSNSLSYGPITDPALPGLAPTAYNPRRLENTTSAMLAGTTGTTAAGRAGAVDEHGALGRTLTRSRVLAMPAGGDGRPRGGAAGNNGAISWRWDRGMLDLRRPNIDIERVEAWGTQGRVWAPSWDVL